MSNTNTQPGVSNMKTAEVRQRRVYRRKHEKQANKLFRNPRMQKKLMEVAKKCSGSSSDIFNPDTPTESRPQTNMETDKVEDNGQAEVITNVSSNVEDNTDTTKDAIKDTLPLRVAEVLNLDSVKLSEVDRFKRRLIRSVARYMLDKVPEEVMWEKLQKDTDCDCLVLWKRMRSLTYKKLRRLLSVGDRWESIAKVARLSTTDWLLFDLVLVHEKVDFIGQDTMTENEQEPKVLKELYELVKKFKIEQLEGEDLIRAWVFLTLEYNRRGRQCSPMLLQRRWYQLKQLARIKFYSFWFAYGGAATKLEKAWQQKPTELQTAIAKTYKFIVTKPFPEWEDLVSCKKVVLREDFENLTQEQPTNNKNVSDVQIIETPIETIELDEESDAENEKLEQNVSPPNDTDIRDKPNTSNEKLEIRIDQIKSEAIDQSVDVQTFETMHIPIQTEISPISLLQSNYKLQPMALSEHEVPIEFDNEVLPKITSVVGGVDLLDSGDVVGDAQKLANNKDIEITAQIANVNETDNVLTTPNDHIVTKNNDYIKSVDETQDYEVPLDDLLIIDDGIALEDEEVYEDDTKEVSDLLQNIKKESNEEEEDDTSDETPKFDHKLLLTPVVYTIKLNDMSVFKFIDFNNVRDKRIIECCYIESTPKSELCISEQEKSKENESVDSESIEHANEGDSNASVNINDITRVNICSWLLQKPKKRSYNPIQLCKNPDFNTRLKRLNAGFLSCERNRLLVKECKPLTIDLHKSFECKLIDGTMYLKDGKFTDNSERIITKCTNELDINTTKTSESSPVEVSMSYIVPIISSPNTFHQKIDNTDKNIVNQSIDVNKSIGTSTSDKKLLTVEITPIKANNIDNRPPVEIVAKRNVINSDCLQDQEVVHQDQTPKGLDEQDNLTENPVCIDLVHPNVQRKMSKHRFQNILSKTLINGPKHYRFGYSLNNPTREPVTWNTGWKTPKNSDVFGGVLLASDTLEKMLYLLIHGNIDEKKNKKKSEKGYARKIKDLQEKMDNKNKPTTCMTIEKNVAVNTDINTEKAIVKKRRKRKSREPDNSQDINHLPRTEYCCWAKEKMTTKREPKEPHYCPHPICNCCCRDSLLEISLGEKAKESLIRGHDKEKKTCKNKMSRKTKHTLITTSISKLSNNPTSDLPIVLSDDDDDIENTPEACQKMYVISDSVCSNSLENINDSIHLNMEKNTNDIDHNKGNFSKSEEQISLNPEISTQNSSLEEDTTLHTNNKQLPPRLKCRVYSKPPSILKKNTSNIQDQISNQHSNNENPLLGFSNAYETPNKSIVFTETLLNKRLSNKSPSQKLPIFLGKNKILLCSNKVKSNMETNVNQISEEAQSVLPQGVQIVLLPNGELTLSIEPGKNFKIDEMNNFSEILAAVQMQVRLSDRNSDVVDCSEILNLKNVDNSINSLPQKENVCKPLVDEQKSTTSIETINVTTPTSQHIEDASSLNTKIVSALDSVGEINKKSCNTHEAANDDHNNETSEQSTDLILQSNKKSILHDLMEMSGISENDSVSDDKMQINTSKETLLPSTPLTTVTLLNNKLAEDITSSHNINTNLNDTISNQPLINKVIDKHNELCIVSSVVELKAFCENKCQFYKMDTVTGEIVPINIKIKKSNKRKQNIISSIKSGPVIDLTDDTTTIEETNSKNPESDNSVTIDNQIKPIKLIRRIRPRKKLKKSLLLDSDNPTSIAPNKKLYSILKQNALQSEISNVNKDLNKITTHRNDTNEGAETNEDKDSESDDEPLAKIAKRQRDIGDIDYEDKTASPENSAPGEGVDDDSTEYLMPEFLETMDCESNGEETEENCILGV